MSRVLAIRRSSAFRTMATLYGVPPEHRPGTVLGADRGAWVRAPTLGTGKAAWITQVRMANCCWDSAFSQSPEDLSSGWPRTPPALVDVCRQEGERLLVIAQVLTVS